MAKSTITIYTCDLCGDSFEPDEILCVTQHVHDGDVQIVVPEDADLQDEYETKFHICVDDRMMLHTGMEEYEKRDDSDLSRYDKIRAREYERVDPKEPVEDREDLERVRFIGKSAGPIENGEIYEIMSWWGDQPIIRVMDGPHDRYFSLYDAEWEHVSEEEEKELPDNIVAARTLDTDDGIIIMQGKTYHVEEWQESYKRKLPKVICEDGKSMILFDKEWEHVSEEEEKEDAKPDKIRIVRPSRSWITQGKIYDVVEWDGDNPFVIDDELDETVLLGTEWERV